MKGVIRRVIKGKGWPKDDATRNPLVLRERMQICEASIGNRRRLVKQAEENLAAAQLDLEEAEAAAKVAREAYRACLSKGKPMTELLETK